MRPMAVEMAEGLWLYKSWGWVHLLLFQVTKNWPRQSSSSACVQKVPKGVPKCSCRCLQIPLCLLFQLKSNGSMSLNKSFSKLQLSAGPTCAGGHLKRFLRVNDDPERTGRICGNNQTERNMKQDLSGAKCYSRWFMGNLSLSFCMWATT